MANYGLKYRAKAYGISPNEWRVDFEEKDYVPGVGETPELLDFAGDGIRIGYDKSDNRFELIYSRYVELTIKTKPSFNIDTLQYDDERKYKIKVYKGNVLEFVGWLIPNYPSQEFEDESISVFSLMAKDSINQLKNFLFKNEQPEEVSRLRSLTDIIAQTLRSTDLGLNFEVFYNKYDVEMAKTINDCPLQQTSVDINSFKKDDGTFLDNYEVLYRVLSTHDLKICQAGGKWIIFSQIELVDGSVSGRYFNYLGVKQGNKTLNTDLGIHNLGLKVLSNTIIRKDSPIQQVSAIFELGDNENLLVNGELDSFEDGLPVDWTLSAGWESYEIEQNEGGGIIIKDTYSTVPSYAGPGDRIEDVNVIPAKNIRSQQINVQGLDSFNLQAEIYADDGIDVVRIRIAIFGITTVKYVDTYGEIKNTSSSIYVNKGTTNASKLVSVPFTLPNDPSFAAQTIQISIYPGIRLRSGVPLNTTVKYKNIILTASSTLKVKDYRGRKWEYNNTNLPTSKKQETITVYFEDNDVNNSQSVNRKNVNKLYFNNTRTGTSAWKRTTESESRLLVESILIDRLAMTGEYGNIIEGSLFGYVSLLDTPTLDNVSRYMVLWSEFNLQRNETEVVIIELKNTTNPISKIVYDVFEDGRLIEVSEAASETEIVKIDESFDIPIKQTGGTFYGGVYVDRGIDSLPINSTDPRATNKGTLLLGPVNAHNIELGNFANNTLVEILGRFGIRNTNNFLGQFSVADLTANRIATLPDRDIEINKWADLSGVPTSFTPSAHFHTIGDVTGLSDALDAKQPLNANLTSLANLSTTGIVRRSGVNTFIIGTNDPITLSGDVTGTGTTAITTTLSNTGVVAGTYRSVTVDAKGRVTAGSVPNYNFEWDSRWNEKLLGYVEFGSDVFVAGGSLGVANNFFLGGLFFDKDSSTGTANQVLMPVTGGVAWTTLSTAQISNFSTNVLGQLLTGFTVGSNTAITSSNSILTAFQNVQAQINAKANSFSGTTNYLPKFTSSTTIGNSILREEGDSIIVDSGVLGANTDNFKTYFTLLSTNVNNSKLNFFEKRNSNGADWTTATTYIQKQIDLTPMGYIAFNPYQGDFGQAGISFGTGFTPVERARLDNRGYFSLGINNALAQFHIFGANQNTISAVSTTSGGGTLYLQDSGAGLYNGGSIIFGASQGAFAAIKSGITDGDNNTKGVLTFHTRQLSTDAVLTQRMIITEIGAVGIGVISPLYTLDVNGTGRFTGAVQFDAIPSCSVAPSLSNHLTNKAYVDSLSFVKKGDNVKTISLTNITLSGTQTINGVALVASDLILVAGQTTASENGVYVVDSGAWTRSTTNDSDAEIRGAYHLITAGTYINQRYINTNGSTITVGTTAITYTLDFGQESDPVWSAFQTANDITVSRIGNWNTAFSWGNHANLYVDKSTTQNDIAGAKTFTTSVQSPIVRVGSGSKIITLFNYFGTSPRISSSASLDFFAPSNDGFSWTTTGDLTQMRLTAAGLLIGGFGPSNYRLQVLGTSAFSGLIHFPNPYTGVYSNGTEGQVLMRRSVSGLNYNEWATLTVARISDIATTYQAIITATENYLIKKTASNFGNSQIFDNGTSVGINTATPNAKVDVSNSTAGNTSEYLQKWTFDKDAWWFGIEQKHVSGSHIQWNFNQRNFDTTVNLMSFKLGNVGIGIEDPTEKLHVNGNIKVQDIDLVGRLKVAGSYGADHYFLKSNGTTQEWAIMNVGEIDDIYDLFASKEYADATYIKRVVDEGERGFFLYADAENTVKEGFFFTNPDTGIMGIHAFRLNGTTVQQYGFQLDKDGLPYWLFADGSRKRILTENDALSGSGGIWTGGTVSTSLNFQFTKNANFLANDGSIIHKQYSSWDGENLFAQQTFGNHIVSSTKGVYLYGGTGDFVYINNVAFDMSNIVSLVGSNAKFSITSLGSGKYKATLVAG